MSSKWWLVSFLDYGIRAAGPNTLIRLRLPSTSSYSGEVFASISSRSSSRIRKPTFPSDGRTLSRGCACGLFRAQATLILLKQQ
jgi:hypothetical protein